MNPFILLSEEKQFEIALQLVIMDAIEKGHTDKNELIEYMKSEVCQDAVKDYVLLMKK